MLKYELQVLKDPSSNLNELITITKMSAPTSASFECWGKIIPVNKLPQLLLVNNNLALESKRQLAQLWLRTDIELDYNYQVSTQLHSYNIVNFVWVDVNQQIGRSIIEKT